MRVTGPDWPTTRLLRERLQNIQSHKVFNFGEQRLNGLQQLQCLKQNQILVPYFTTTQRQALQWEQENPGSVWGRRKNHTKGRDIVDYSRRRKWLESDFWVKVIPDIQEEWRISVFNGFCIARGLKVPGGQIERPGNIVQRRGLPIRNRLTGWGMRHDIAPTQQIREIAKRAVMVCEYLYGGVDLAITESGNVYVFEINQAQGMDEYTVSAYVKAITAWATRE